MKTNKIIASIALVGILFSSLNISLANYEKPVAPSNFNQSTTTALDKILDSVYKKKDNTSKYPTQDSYIAYIDKVNIALATMRDKFDNNSLKYNIVDYLVKGITNIKSSLDDSDNIINSLSDIFNDTENSSNSGNNIISNTNFNSGEIIATPGLQNRCMYDGTRSEGWYDPFGKLIKFEDCISSDKKVYAGGPNFDETASGIINNTQNKKITYSTGISNTKIINTTNYDFTNGCKLTANYDDIFSWTKSKYTFEINSKKYYLKYLQYKDERVKNNIIANKQFLTAFRIDGLNYYENKFFCDNGLIRTLIKQEDTIYEGAICNKLGDSYGNFKLTKYLMSNPDVKIMNNGYENVDTLVGDTYYKGDIMCTGAEGNHKLYLFNTQTYNNSENCYLTGNNNNIDGFNINLFFMAQLNGYMGVLPSVFISNDISKKMKDENTYMIPKGKTKTAYGIIKNVENKKLSYNLNLYCNNGKLEITGQKFNHEVR